MSFDAIMKQIQSGLTGSNKEDIVYLRKQIQEYKDHPLQEAIQREIGKMIYDRLDANQQQAYRISIEKDQKQTEQTLKEVEYYREKKEFDKALSILRPIIKTMEKETLFKNDQIQDYFSFHEPFEQALYMYLEKPKKKVSTTPVMYSDVYYLYACLWKDKGEQQACHEALEKALAWNPMSSKIHFLYMSEMDDLEKYFAYTKFAFQYMFHPRDIAQLYKNFATYYEKKNQPNYQYGCLGLSLQFVEDESVMKQMQDLETPTFVPASLEDLKKAGLPIGADQTVVGLAYGYGKTYVEKKQYDQARYYLQIAYDLTHAQEVKEMLREMKN